LLVLIIQCCIVGFKAKLVKWSPPMEVTKIKINTDASISESNVYTGFVLFDHRGIQHFRSVKLCQTQKIEVAEAIAVEEALIHVVQHNYPHVDIETDNSFVSDAMNGISRPSANDKMKEFWETIHICRKLIAKKDIKISWIPRELNRVADYIVGHVQRQDEIDKIITKKTWEAMYGASHVLVANITSTKEQHKVEDSIYVFSPSDKDAQAILHWIDTGMIS
jgi:ribonuclease HI